jgi:hypothetical protein
MMRLAALALVALACVGPVSAQAQAPVRPPLQCSGGFTQGGTVICKTAPGAMLILDGEERGAADENGWAVAGFARDSKPTAVIAARALSSAPTVAAVCTRKAPGSRTPAFLPLATLSSKTFHGSGVPSSPGWSA